MKTAIKNIRRSPFQALAAIFVITLTLFIIGIFSLVTLASQVILLSFETKPQVIAYLKDDHTQPQVNNLIHSLQSTEGIKSAQYISKENALELYKKSVGNDPILLGSITDWGVVTADILPASIEITASNPESFPSIVKALETSDLISTNPQGKKEIDFPQDVVQELSRWTSGIRTAGLILIAVLSLVCILTIITIISMKISSRRSEISTMKLLGASNWFIIRPYLQESLIYGFFGGLISWSLTFIAVLYSTPFLAPRLSTVLTFPVPYTVIGLLYCALTAIGISLSYLSTLFATTRFVKRSK